MSALNASEFPVACRVPPLVDKRQQVTRVSCPALQLPSRKMKVGITLAAILFTGIGIPVGSMLFQQNKAKG